MRKCKWNRGRFRFTVLKITGRSYRTKDLAPDRDAGNGARRRRKRRGCVGAIGAIALVESVKDGLTLTDVATAFLLAAEAGDFSRFPTAPSFASWCGLAPSERSSGETESRGGITRAGNGHVRRALVEASWHVPMSTRHPKRSRHAAKCNRRLQESRDAMSAAGKKPCAANCATAREMACWVWAIALMAR